MSNNNSYIEAEKEFFEQMDMDADFATGQHQIGIYHETKGEIDLAIKAYRKAIKMDNWLNISRMNLALLLYKQGNTEEVIELYLKVIEQEPDYGDSYYMLGLLYNEIGDSKNALKYLEIASNKKPINIRAFYNYALKLQAENMNQKSIEVINKALSIFPDNENLLYVKLIAEMNLKQHVAAYNTCSKLIQLAPHNANYQQILQSLQ